MSLLLLDRDGVINVDRPTSVLSIEDFELIPNAAQAIAAVNKLSIPVVVITNQACVGRGELSEQGLNDIHTHMQKLLSQHGAHVNEIIYCTDATPSPRRKPSPGMLEEALSKYNAPPETTYFVGDALRDLEAAYVAKCIPALVKTGKGLKTIEKGLPTHLQETITFEDLNDFVSKCVHPVL